MLKTNLFGFNTNLTDMLKPTDTDLPIPATQLALIESIVNTEDYVYLVVSDNVHSEVIKIQGTCNSFTVIRGQDNTLPRAFPKGSCVSFKLTPQIVKDMICQTDCCEEINDCCIPITVAGSQLPQAHVGVPYSANVIFSGSTPMNFATANLPSWASATYGSNYVKISGTPNATSIHNIAVSGTNCTNSIAVANTVLTTI